MRKMLRQPCLICGTACKGPKQKFCSYKCMGLGKRREKPKCKICGQFCKGFRTQYCSTECAAICRRGSNWTGKDTYKLKCQNCSCDFTSNNLYRKYCSAKCNPVGNKLDYTVSHLNNKMLEILDGHMLGDGNIEKPSRLASRLNIKQKEEQFAKYIANLFSPYQINVRSISRWDNRTNKFYHSWAGRSPHHPDFLKQYERWYPDGKKRIPRDCRITPISVLLWYLGDGTLDRLGRGRPRIAIATMCFEDSEIKDILLPQLNAMSPGGFRADYKNNIRASKDATEKFFGYIGYHSPVECYNYKFLSKEDIKNNRLSILRNRRTLDWDIILSMRAKGSSIIEISHKLGYAYGSVWDILQKCKGIPA